MAHEKKKEFGKFASVGMIATVIDYGLLNLFAVIFSLPVLIANSISAPISSFVSYKLNKHVVFEDRMHSRRRTILLYIAILGFGILVIQNGLLHFLYDTIGDDIAKAIKPMLDALGMERLTIETIALNLSKAGASAIAALWNYFMLRRYVFVTQEDAAS